MSYNQEDLTIPIKPSETLGVDEILNNSSTATYRFKRLVDYKAGEAWTVLIYGPTKSGKTWFVGSAGSRTLLVNTGSGLATLQSPAFRAKFPNSKDIIVVDVYETDPENKATAFVRVF